MFSHFPGAFFTFTFLILLCCQRKCFTLSTHHAAFICLLVSSYIVRIRLCIRYCCIFIGCKIRILLCIDCSDLLVFTVTYFTINHISAAPATLLISTSILRPHWVSLIVGFFGTALTTLAPFSDLFIPLNTFLPFTLVYAFTA